LNGLEQFVQAAKTALGERPGEIAMHVQPEAEVANAVGDNMLSAADRENIAKANWRSETVPVMRLDDWAEGVGVAACELIKIDVEGADLQVLRSGARLIERSRPIIMGEFNPYWMLQSGETFEDVINYFKPMGYAFWREMEGQFVPLTPALIAPPLEIPTYLLVPRERVAQAVSLMRNLKY
jgi:FkbM family methyltransferase